MSEGWSEEKTDIVLKPCKCGGMGHLGFRYGEDLHWDLVDEYIVMCDKCKKKTHIHDGADAAAWEWNVEM